MKKTVSGALAAAAVVVFAASADAQRTVVGSAATLDRFAVS